jgi:2-oxoglutarate ferredoxin oxidoreductase subunit gamma
MSQQAYDRYHPDNRQDALVIIDEDLVKPIPDEHHRLLTIPARRMAEELGRVAVANVVMLGFLTAVANMATVDSMRKSLLAAVPKGTEELNMKAFERGYAYGLEKLGLSGERKK